MNRSFLITVFLCMVISCFANKRTIDLEDRARCLMPPIEVFIDGVNLELHIQEDIGTVNVSIQDFSGNVVFSTFIDGKIGNTPMKLEVKSGFYIIVIDCEDNRFYGDFSVE